MIIRLDSSPLNDVIEKAEMYHPESDQETAKLNEIIESIQKLSEKYKYQSMLNYFTSFINWKTFLITLGSLGSISIVNILLRTFYRKK